MLINEPGTRRKKAWQGRLPCTVEARQAEYLRVRWPKQVEEGRQLIC